MKIIYNILSLALLLVFAASCDKGIDPISAVDPGPDQTAPVVKINYPIEGTLIRIDEPVTSVKIQLEASDDIELATITVKLDGTQIASFSSFKDYRRSVQEYIYDALTDGEHELIVTATDISGKTGSETVHFLKTTPYHAIYEGEVFYMPFDGDNMELVTNTEATKFGFPSYVDGKKGKAYAGATDSYLTFPATAILGTEFSLSFWYKLNATPARAGILSISRPYVVYKDSTRFKGFRMARENSGTKQNLFVNLGTGAAEVWINPFVAAAQDDAWMHIAVSVSTTTATIYVNNVVAKTATLTAPINWQDCTLLSIASGAPNFTYWEHFSDLSQFDELRIFTKAITAEEVALMYSAK